MVMFIEELARKLKRYWMADMQAGLDRLASKTVVSQPSTSSDAAALIAAHAAQDFAAAHPTQSPATNKRRTYYSYNFGIRGGSVTDESNNIAAMLNTVGLAGGGICYISAASSADPVIRIEKTISIYYSNVDVVFDPATKVSMGVKSCIRVMGSQDEFTRKGDLSAIKIRVNSTVNASNQTVLEMGSTDSALMDAEAVPANRIVRVGDKLMVRGQNDASGKAIEKDSTFVAALAKVGSYWQITCVDELDYTFQPTYSGSDWPADATTGTTIYIVRYASLTADLPAGSWSAVFGSVSGFAVDDIVQIGDSRTEFAYNASAVKSDGTGYKNPAALELVRIIAVDAGTNTLSFDRATTRAYKAAGTFYGGVAKCLMVRNSSISGARMSYHGQQTSTSYNALQLTYAAECTVSGCTIDGRAGRVAHAIRMSYALNCVARDNVILDCYLSGSGQGYGITDYYSTGNRIHGNVISGCRHNILLQLATNSIIYANESRNHLISGIDAHGVNSYGCHIYGNTVTQANGSTSDSGNASGIRIGNTSHSVGDHFFVVEDNVLIYNGGTNDMAFDVIANSSNIVFRNNTVFGANIGFKFTLNSKQITPVQTATNITLEGNRFIGCLGGALSVTGQPTYDNIASNGKLDKVAFINNTADGCVGNFKITGASGITNVRMEGNRILNDASASTGYAYQVSNVAGLLLLRNSARGAQRGVSLTSCTSAAMIDNDLTGLLTGTTYVYVDGGGNTGLFRQLNVSDLGVTENIAGTTAAFSGLVTASGGLRAPRSAGAADFMLDSAGIGGVLTVNSGATVAVFGVADVFSGELTINDTTVDGVIAKYLCGGALTTLLGSTLAICSNTAGTASKINVYYSSSILYIQNNLGTNRVFAITAIRTRTTT